MECIVDGLNQPLIVISVQNVEQSRTDCSCEHKAEQTAHVSNLVITYFLLVRADPV